MMSLPAFSYGICAHGFGNDRNPFVEKKQVTPIALDLTSPSAMTLALVQGHPLFAGATDVHSSGSWKRQLEKLRASAGFSSFLEAATERQAHILFACLQHSGIKLPDNDYTQALTAHGNPQISVHMFNFWSRLESALQRNLSSEEVGVVFFWSQQEVRSLKQLEEYGFKPDEARQIETVPF